MKIKNLDELLEKMKNRELDGEKDWENLPTFGGEEPGNTECIWSWDTERLIVGLCPDDVYIISRSDYSELMG